MRNRNMSDSAASVVPARNSWWAVLKDEPNMTGADELSLLEPALITQTLVSIIRKKHGAEPVIK